MIKWLIVLLGVHSRTGKSDAKEIHRLWGCRVEVYPSPACGGPCRLASTTRRIGQYHLSYLHPGMYNALRELGTVGGAHGNPT